MKSRTQVGVKKSSCWMDGVVMLGLPLLCGLVLRTTVGLHPHSGQSKPPMFGDYEAQRHWMEITTNLQPSMWYQNSSDNDLEYWGLDYPPITAYHSWLLGKFSESINPNWTRLHLSRGEESYDHKVFMRRCVLVSDLLTFIPAVLLFFFQSTPINSINSKITSFYACAMMLTFPGLILIDHGHFQFNCVSLGLFIASICALFNTRHLIATFAFCLALGYKQMELYHSLPLFFYLLGYCLHMPIAKAFKLLSLLVLTTLLSVGLIFYPFLHSFDALGQVVHRIFPIARGLYEDKVANFWCVTNILVKWNQLFATSQLIKLCTLSVLLTSLPACFVLLLKPTRLRLLYSLAISSLSFYLFSYQVHEKSILLAAVPILCLGQITPLASLLFSLASTCSMWPLFVKDQLEHASLCLIVLYTITAGGLVLQVEAGRSPALRLLLLQSITFILLVIGQFLIAPPSRYPDLFPLLHSAVAFIQFTGFLFYYYWKLFSLSSSNEVE